MRPKLTVAPSLGSLKLLAAPSALRCRFASGKRSRNVLNAASPRMWCSAYSHARVGASAATRASRTHTRASAIPLSGLLHGARPYVSSTEKHGKARESTAKARRPTVRPEALSRASRGGGLARRARRVTQSAGTLMRASRGAESIEQSAGRRGRRVREAWDNPESLARLCARLEKHPARSHAAGFKTSPQPRARTLLEEQSVSLLGAGARGAQASGSERRQGPRGSRRRAALHPQRRSAR